VQQAVSSCLLFRVALLWCRPDHTAVVGREHLLQIGPEGAVCIAAVAAKLPTASR
jgi:hypothetical protein